MYLLWQELHKLPMIQLPQLWQCLTIQRILDLLIAGNALLLMVSCVTTMTTVVRLKLLDHPIEHMVFVVNQVSLENIAIVKELTLAVNLQVDLETGLVVFSLMERIIKCLLTVLVLEIKNHAELVKTKRILI